MNSTESSPGADYKDSPEGSPDQCEIRHQRKTDDPEISDDENEDYADHGTSSISENSEDRSPRGESVPPLSDRTKNILIKRTTHKKYREGIREFSIGKSLPREKNDSRGKAPNVSGAGKTYTCGICVLIVISLALYGAFNFLGHVNSSPQSTPNEVRFNSFVGDLRSIKKQFPNQNSRTWSDIRAGVGDMINGSTKPWIFLLFSNEPRRTSCLADLIGQATGKALLSNDTLHLNPDDLGYEYGDTIDRLRPLITEKKAVVVYDILNIHPGAIQAFHTMCDRENPLVNEAIYIITMIAPGYNISQRAEVFVENKLTERFVDRVPEDKLQPLITRLTDGPIIPVASGDIPNRCSL